MKIALIVAAVLAVQGLFIYISFRMNGTTPSRAMRKRVEALLSGNAPIKTDAELWRPDPGDDNPARLFQANLAGGRITVFQYVGKTRRGQINVDFADGSQVRWDFGAGNDVVALVNRLADRIAAAKKGAS